MSAKWTPGPWKFAGPHSRHVYGPDAIAVCTLRAYADDAMIDQHRMKVDGKLIAAAPELADMLAECCSVIEAEVIIAAGLEMRVPYQLIAAANHARALLERIRGGK